MGKASSLVIGVDFFTVLICVREKRNGDSIQAKPKTMT
jgi:hypothetical protein